MRRVMLGLAVAALVGLGGSTAAVAASDVIKAPAGNKRIAVMPAHGVQTYQCTAGAWTFLQPDAILTHHGRPEVLHSKGPVTPRPAPVAARAHSSTSKPGRVRLGGFALRDGAPAVSTGSCRIHRRAVSA
jgi:hypothetical protein